MSTHKTIRLMLALVLLGASSCSTVRFSSTGASARRQAQRINELEAETQAFKVQVHELEIAEADTSEEIAELYERLLQVMLKLNIDAPAADLSETTSPTRSSYP